MIFDGSKIKIVGLKLLYLFNAHTMRRASVNIASMKMIPVKLFWCREHIFTERIFRGKDMLS